MLVLQCTLCFIAKSTNQTAEIEMFLSKIQGNDFFWKHMSAFNTKQ